MRRRAGAIRIGKVLTHRDLRVKTGTPLSRAPGAPKTEQNVHPNLDLKGVSHETETGLECQESMTRLLPMLWVAGL